MCGHAHSAHLAEVHTAGSRRFPGAAPNVEEGLHMTVHSADGEDTGRTAPSVARPPRQLCAGGIVFDDDRRLLLIRRGRPPSLGSWSIPGGRCRPGETTADACVRELAEETGLVVEVERYVGRVERDAPDGGIYEIEDFLCRVVGGELQAGDDAADARWVSAADLSGQSEQSARDGMTFAPGLLDALTAWGLLRLDG